MGTEPTLPLPAGEPGQFPPPTDPWSTPDLHPDPTSDPGAQRALPPPQPTSGPPQSTSGPPQTSSWPPQSTSGPPQTSSWPPQPTGGQPHPTSGQPYQTSGPPWPASGPPGPLPPGGDVTVVAQIGEIQVTSKLVHTPAGSFPLAGSSWHVSDFWQTEQKTPTWAILVAIFGNCVVPVFALLFLLVKETVHRGTVQVTVSNGRHQYVARNPVANQDQVHYLHQQVNYVRALAAL